MLTSLQYEARVLEIIDRVKRRQPVEDELVELKQDWPPDGARAGRLIAAHANAARGQAIWWLIGVDEKTGTVTGASFTEFSAWHAQVNAQFDEVWPDLLFQRNVPVDGKSVAALVFDTSRAPFVVKNPTFGKTKGEVEFEAPWRVGTAAKSARREDLIRILAPVQAVPDFEVLGGLAVCDEAQSKANFSIEARLYIMTRTPGAAIFPLHRAKISVEAPYGGDKRSLTMTATRISPRRNNGVTLASSTVIASASETLVTGAGEIVVSAEDNFNMRGEARADLDVVVRLGIVNATHPIVASLRLYPKPTTSHPEWSSERKRY